MIIAFIENKETSAKLRKVSGQRIDFAIHELVEKLLRKEFQDACTSPTAFSVIDKALQYGYNDLAEELTNDFYVETGREVQNG